LKFKTLPLSKILRNNSCSVCLEFRQCENNWRFFTVGFCKGLYSDTTVPKFNIEIASNNASFKYLTPKTVENIVIDTKIINETGILNDTYVNLEKLSFKLIKMFLMPSQH
jgi:hypothetical protein